MKRFDDKFRKVKVQELIDRILYLDKKEFNEFMRSYDALCDAYRPSAQMNWRYEDVQDIPQE
jgi:hypothetical protein